MYHPDVALFFQTPWSQAGAGLACDPGLRMGGDRNRSREGLMAPPPTSDVMTWRAFPSAPHVRGAGGQGAWAAHRAPPPAAPPRAWPKGTAALCSPTSDFGPEIVMPAWGTCIMTHS